MLGTTFEELLGDLQVNEENQNEILNGLNDLIRKDSTVREKDLPDLFYKLINKSLKTQLTNESTETFWLNFEILIKLIKNSAAAFKSKINSDEIEICQLLTKFAIDLKDNSESYKKVLNSKSCDSLKQKCFVFILQYFFNSSQGNTNLLKHFLTDWTTLSCDLIFYPDVQNEIHNVSVMILVNTCIDKHNESILNKNFENIGIHEFIKLISKAFSTLEYVHDKIADDKKDKNAFNDIDQEELEYLVDETDTNWYMRLISYLFDYLVLENEVFLEKLLNKYQDFELIDRINLLKLLKIKLFMSKRSNNSLSNLFNASFIERFIEIYKKAVEFFLTYLVELTESNELENINSDRIILIHMHIGEIKHQTYCLSDLITLEHHSNNSIQKNKLQFAQNNDFLLKNTCNVFLELYKNPFFKDASKILENNDIYKLSHSNLKCELIRLIGILIYENAKNQYLVAQNGVMDLIASANMSMDIRNPFIREWSLIALRHILVKNDYSNTN